MQRTKNSILNIITVLFNTVVNSLIGLITINLTIKIFGSELNGFIATVSQLIVLLSLVEGGIALATNATLYKPYIKNEKDKVNAILSGTRIVFLVIAALFTVISVSIAFIYPYIVKSDTNNLLMTTIFIMAVIPVSVGFLTDQYRILFQVSQKEYILSTISTVTTLLGQFVSIIIMLLDGGILLVRFSIMVFAVISSICVLIIFHRRFKEVSFKVKPDFTAVKSTFYVAAQKFTFVLYTSLPMLLVSSYAGTVYASVYMVYNSIFMLVKNAVYAFVNAPINGFGQLIAEIGAEKAGKTFRTFEFITVLVLNILLTTTIVMILPFIRIFTRGVNDINYLDGNIAILFMIVVALEMIHVPSGIIINVTGHFKLSRNIQIFAFLILCVTSFTFAPKYGVYGVLIANIICNTTLSGLEIYFAHNKILGIKTKEYYKILFFNTVLSIVISFIGFSFNLVTNSYIEFCIIGIISFLCISGIIVAFNYIYFKKDMVIVIERFKGLALNKLGHVKN